MNHKLERYWLKFFEWIPWLVAALAVLSANWAASAVSETIQVLLDSAPIAISPLRIAYVAFFTIMVVLFYFQRNTFLRPHTRHLSIETAERKKHLVLFLSSLPLNLEKSNGMPKGLNLRFCDLEKDLDAMAEGKTKEIRWPWEMPLRAIRHHLGILETVTLICSEESLPHAHLFIEICERYDSLKNITFYLLARKDKQTCLINELSPSAIGSYKGWDFESVDELSSALWVLIKEFKNRNYFEHETVVDFTGGQKPTSVVAATMTFNRQIKAQYVQTNAPWNVLSYDVVLASPETGRLGI